MAEFAALPLFTDALLSDTGHLTDAEFGLYMRLLVLLWRSPECRIPNDKAWIAKRLRRTPLEYATDIAPLIAEFCTTDGNYVFQKRLLKEFEYTREKKHKSKNAAKARWGNTNAAHDADETQTKRKKTQKNASSETVGDNPLKQHDLDLCLGDAPTPTPTPTELYTLTGGGVSVVTQTEDEEKWFQEKFWNPYPKTRAGSKDAARKAMKKALTKTSKEELENAVIRYAQSDEVARGYGKGAAAWLNDERWTHDYRPGRAETPQGGKHHHKKASYLDKVHNAGAKARELVQARLEAEDTAPWGEQGQLPAGGAPLRLTAREGIEPDGD